MLDDLMYRLREVWNTPLSNAAADELTRLRAEVEALRADKERLDFLADTCVWRLCGEDVWGWNFQAETPHLREALDDAARKEMK